ncbi:MAG: hypothetical protein V1740_04415 [Candidatus Woesearchaeota archaeon]
MNKKIIYTILGVIFLLSLFIIIYGIVMYVNVSKLGTSLYLIRDGAFQGMETGNDSNSEIGLQKCDELMYFQTVCYMTALGLKLYMNETNAEFCERMPVDERIPFWWPDKKQWKQNIVQSKKKCFESIENK